MTVGLAHAYGKDRLEIAATLRRFMKGTAQVARYLRQAVPWVESLELDELNRWSDVVSEILIEERGGSADGDGPPSDPFHAFKGED